MRKIDSERIPIYIWADEVDEETLRQTKNIANLPIAYHHVALMPDAHVGFGMPIGGVLATEDAIVPNAVGVDIGCGMHAVRTSLKDVPRSTLETIASKIRSRIPLGFEHHKHPRSWEGFQEAPDLSIVRQELDSARHQLGTLGGGNHFIELQKDHSGHLWIMVHSGSRNFGLKIAEEYNRKAKNYCSEHKLSLPDSNLAYLPVDSKLGREYIEGMNFALRFARENRRQIMEDILYILEEISGPFEVTDRIDIHHNYAAPEKHYGKEVIVHRKGATAAHKSVRGIIPGSQGSSSFIVEGKDNPLSFKSCSHGAGRRLGRNEARKKLSLEEEVRRLESLGVIHAVRKPKDLDEASGAYKDIHRVMDAQKDLVDIVMELHPLAVVKG
ncbi:MAG: RtcB family protein [Spirochaetes bacterium]|nr:RtcB family protein [Spirochaetota bacterium]